MNDCLDRQNSVRTGLVIASLLAIGCGVLLVWFAVLRESRVFWTHVGGSPLWLRDLVLLSYMPLFVGTAGLLCALSIACSLRIVTGLRFLVVELLLILLGWGLVATSGCIAFQNNVRNIVTGTPIHNHEPVR